MAQRPEQPLHAPPTPALPRPSEPTESSAPAPPAAPADSPLTAEHYQQVRLARGQRRRIDRAVALAGFNAGCTAVCAAVSLPFAFANLTALIAFVALTALAAVEFIGRAMLRRLDLRGPMVLGCNQLAFALLLIAYSLWSIYQVLAGPSQIPATIANDPQLVQMFGSVENLYRMLAMAVYGGVILGSLIFNGGMAWYYFSRRAYLRAYLEQTPKWVLELER